MNQVDNNLTPDNNRPNPGGSPNIGGAGAQPTGQNNPVNNDSTVAPQQTDQSVAVPNPATPTVAEDADLIEKEWVVKAKHIVEKTRDNPYMLNKEINKVKADYIKKRFNKDIKSPDN